MRWLILVVCLFALLPARTVTAHPHAWTDVVVEILFDKTGGITGLRQIWLFDDFYSAFAVEGMDADGDGKADQDKLDEILKVNMENLREYDYFTKAWVGEKTLKLRPVTEMSTRLNGNRLEMTFVTEFSKPITDPKDHFSYSIFDPTYYIEMLHSEAEKPVLLTNAPSGCEYVLVKPDPDPSVVAEAAMLDATVRGETGLGQFFAEQVDLTCPAK